MCCLGLLDNLAEHQSHIWQGSPKMILPGYVFSPYLLFPVVKTTPFFVTNPNWFRANNSRKSVPTTRTVGRRLGDSHLWKEAGQEQNFQWQGVA